MTSLRKILLGAVIVAALTVPVGVAYAADSGGPSRVPGSGMVGRNMDPADCPHHGEHRAQMRDDGAEMGGMHDQMGTGQGPMGNWSTGRSGT